MIDKIVVGVCCFILGIAVCALVWQIVVAVDNYLVRVCGS